MKCLISGTIFLVVLMVLVQVIIAESLSIYRYIPIHFYISLQPLHIPYTSISLYMPPNLQITRDLCEIIAERHHFVATHDY